MNQTLPNLYGLIKLHKDGQPMRPITTFLNTPTNRLCKIMSSVLTGEDFPLTHTIKNSQELTDKLGSINTQGIKLLSFEVENLYRKYANTIYSGRP